MIIGLTGLGNYLDLLMRIILQVITEYNIPHAELLKS